jgi:hypothetical protein
VVLPAGQLRGYNSFPSPLFQFVDVFITVNADETAFRRIGHDVKQFHGGD